VIYCSLSGAKIDDWQRKCLRQNRLGRSWLREETQAVLQYEHNSKKCSDNFAPILADLTKPVSEKTHTLILRGDIFSS
jgi:hypothetical protein